ncbi:hypothetical protein NC651_002999 [Populus alba x Populus x berolinensis]|nr:hypothetical protein NC651_002999 [Populus alba x Populus x berolinensis]
MFLCKKTCGVFGFCNQLVRTQNSHLFNGTSIAIIGVPVGYVSWVDSLPPYSVGFAADLGNSHFFGFQFI